MKQCLGIFLNTWGYINYTSIKIVTKNMGEVCRGVDGSKIGHALIINKLVEW